MKLNLRKLFTRPTVAIPLFVVVCIYLSVVGYQTGEKMSEKKKYDLPENLVDLGQEMRGLQELRDKYVQKNNGYEDVQRAARDYSKVRHEFWRLVRELYPEIEGKPLDYRYVNKFVTEMD